MTPNEQKLQAVETQIHAIEQELRIVYGAKIGLAELLQRAELAAREHIMWQSRNAPFTGSDIANAVEALWARNGGRECSALAGVHAAVSAVEKHPRYAEAVKTFDPLFTERDNLRAAIAAEKAAHDAAHAAACDAEREATAKALAAVETDPSVISARRALAAFDPAPASEPAPLVRGKFKVPSEATA